MNEKRVQVICVDEGEALRPGIELGAERAGWIIAQDGESFEKVVLASGPIPIWAASHKGHREHTMLELRLVQDEQPNRFEASIIEGEPGRGDVVRGIRHDGGRRRVSPEDAHEVVKTYLDWDEGE